MGSRPKPGCGFMCPGMTLAEKTSKRFGRFQFQSPETKCQQTNPLGLMSPEERIIGGDQEG